MNGFTEILTWILCSYKENFSMLNRKDDKSTAVIIGNPRSADFEVCLFNNCSQWWCAYLYSLKKYVSATISWNINLLFGFLMLIEMGFLFFFFSLWMRECFVFNYFFYSLFCFCSCFVSIFEGRVDSWQETDDASSIIAQLPMSFKFELYWQMFIISYSYLFMHM